jgi:hypothetical protein
MDSSGRIPGGTGTCGSKALGAVDPVDQMGSRVGQVHAGSRDHLGFGRVWLDAGIFWMLSILFFNQESK